MVGVRTIAICAVLLGWALRPADVASPKEAIADFALYAAGPRAPAAPLSADLALTIGDSPDPVPPGEDVTYTIHLTNNGPGKARSVFVTDTLPSDLTFVSCAADEGGVCLSTGRTQRIKFETLPAGQTATITLVARVRASAPLGSQIVNKASVHSQVDSDPQPGNDSATAQTAVLLLNRATEGEWSGPFMWPVVAIHLSVLPDGRVMIWDASDDPALVGDPIAGTFTPLSNTTNSLFCAGHSYLADGRLFLAGGHPSGGADSGIGAPDINIFDYRTDSFTVGVPMDAGRWYPTTVTLPNGNVLILAGQADRDSPQDMPLIANPDGTWSELVNARRLMPFYPRLHIAPNGRVFYAGEERESRYLNTSGSGAWTPVATTRFARERNYGTSVMYEEGKVLIVGGGGRGDGGPLPTNTAEVIDLQSGGGWRYTSPMAFARRQLNATILADGKVLVTGGTSSRGFNDGTASVFAAELWDPQTEAWTTVASMQVRRLYHSTAALLPDGRVISAGGWASSVPLDPPDRNHNDAEIYSPPYLFAADGSLAPRPAITSAPSSIGYGETFFVATPDAAGIERVNLIALSAVTHAINMTQRLSRLDFSVAPGGGGLDVTAPASAALAPPGPYMLFLLDGNGVPSVASILFVG